MDLWGKRDERESVVSVVSHPQLAGGPVASQGSRAAYGAPSRHQVGTKRHSFRNNPMPEKRLTGVTKARGHRHVGFQAQIRCNDQVIVWPKRLPTEEEAARVWDTMAVYIYGSERRLNFDGNPPPSITRAEIKGFLVRRGVLPKQWLDREPPQFR